MQIEEQIIVKDTNSLVEELKNQFKIGNLSVKNPLHKQIWFYLEIPELSPTEQNALGILKEQIAIQHEWEKEKIENYPAQKEKINK
jgi:hypothetical protein